MHKTIQSEVFPLKTVLLSPVSRAFKSDKTLGAHWQDLNYSAVPDFSGALAEYGAFEAIFRRKGIKTMYLPESGDTTPDVLYCRDASVATDYGMIICNMGKLQRSMEPPLHEAFYLSHGIPVLGRIRAPGTLEGGDVAWLDPETLAVAHSYRTNLEGISQLKAMLAPFGIGVMVASLPHYKGPGDVFHLMSALSPVAEKTAVVYSPLLPIAFRNELLSRKFRLLEVPEDEFITLGCNVLALSTETCVMVSGNPKTQNMLESEGIEVIAYRGKEISVKGGGGPTCLTRPLER